MSEYLTEVTAISSKGQIVLPKAIRDSLSLSSGTRMMVMSDGENVLLKPIRKPDLSEFQAMTRAAQQWAREVGLTEDDIGQAIQAVRKARRTGNANCD